MEDGVLAEINPPSRGNGFRATAHAKKFAASRQRYGYLYAKPRDNHQSCAGAGGSSPLDRVRGCKLYGSAGRRVVIYGYPTPVQSVDGWWHSFGHYAILTKPNITEIGLDIQEHFWNGVVGF